MYLDVSKALNDVGYDEKFQISATIDEVSYQGNIASCKWDDQILVRALNTGKGEAILEVSGGFSYNLPCDRCLKPVENHMELEFSHQVLLESNEKVIEKLDDEDFMHLQDDLDEFYKNLDNASDEIKLTNESTIDAEYYVKKYFYEEKQSKCRELLNNYKGFLS